MWVCACLHDRAYVCVTCAYGKHKFLACGCVHVCMIVRMFALRVRMENLNFWPTRILHWLSNPALFFSFFFIIAKANPALFLFFFLLLLILLLLLLLLLIANPALYPQSIFLIRNKKNNVYPWKPQFYYIKVRFKGVKFI